MTEPINFSIPVSEIAINYPQSITVFNELNIDYCCGGHLSFELACEKVNQTPQEIWNQIQERTRSAGFANFTTWDSSLLCDYITQHHHHYVRDAIPEILSLLDKVCEVHGEVSPQLHLIQNEFKKLANDLLQHMKKEETILFPAIKEFQHPYLSGPILAMENEHEIAGELIKSIRSLTSNYTPPAHACPTYQVTFKKLKEFEIDLMQHIHLENNILFPKIKTYATQSANIK